MTLSKYDPLTLLFVLVLAVGNPGKMYAQPNSDESEQTADEYGQWFSIANDQYARGAYDSAIVLYERLIEQEAITWEVLYNLGNAHYKEGNIAPSILQLERALKLQPKNKDIRFNLEIANLSQQDKIIEAVPENILSRTWKKIITIFSTNSWTSIALLSLWLALVGIAIYSFSRGALQRMGFYGFLLTLFIFALTLLFAFSRSGYDKANRFAIVMSPSAVIKSEPKEASTNLYLLREGFKLKLLDRVGEWGKVQLADGNQGWVLNTNIEEI